MVNNCVCKVESWDNWDCCCLLWYCSTQRRLLVQGGLAQQVAPPWLSTPVAMLLKLAAAGNHPVMPRARPYKPPTPLAYAPACRRPMSKLSYDHPPKSVCTLSADNERIVGDAMYEQPPSSLVGTSPLRCWFLADEARRGAFSSGLLLLVQA